MTTVEPDPLDAPTAALAAAVLEVARHVEGTTLAAPRLFALARSAELMAASPSLAALLGAEGEGANAHDDLHLTPIDLDDGSDEGKGASPQDPLAVLESVQWPELAAGGAIACDLAPSAWSVRDEEHGSGADAPETDGAEQSAARNGADLSPDGVLRVVVAALADGTTWSAVHRGDEDGYVLGAALLPEISRAQVQTVQSDS